VWSVAEEDPDMADQVERRLTTILAADVAEYSRLMRVDEEGTRVTHPSCRAIVDGLIAGHRGRIANTAADSVLAEFPSVAEALSCALSIQLEMAKRNQELPPDRRMLLRIGIHLGDALVKDGDLFGDAVNIAARLEALVEPGGICISATVREHVGSRVAAAFTDIGAQKVKNIAEPVRVFRVMPRDAVPSVEVLAEAPPLPDKPSVAVRPFTNMSADPEQEFFADGVAENIITALSRYPSLFVIARNSSFTYKGRAVDVKQVGPSSACACVMRSKVVCVRLGTASGSPGSWSRQAPATTSGPSATTATSPIYSRSRTRSLRP
jgi:adenylate cyclase